MNKINLNLYFKKRKQRLSVFGISPQFDWYILIMTAFLGVVVGGIYAIYLYTNLSNGRLFKVEDDQSQYLELEQKKMRIQKKVDALEKRNFDETTTN